MIFKKFKPKIKNNFKFKAENITSFDLKKKENPIVGFL